MKAPAFQFYPKDFLASPDVQMMDAKEVGAYCLLLFTAWEATDLPGHLPNDERKLQRWARLTKEEWLEAREVLLEKFPVSACGQYRFNRRLVAEAAKQEVRRERLAENGRKGGRPPKNQEQTSEEATNNLQVSEENQQVSKTKADERLAFSSASAFATSSADKEKKIETPSSFHSEGVAPAKVESLEEVESLQVEVTPLTAPTRGLRTPGGAAPKARALSFSESPYATLASVEQALAGTEYAYADLRYYHEVIRNWAEGKGEKKVDWLAAIRGWILRDSKDNKLKTLHGTQHVNGTHAHNHGAQHRQPQPNGRLDIEAAVCIAGDIAVGLDATRRAAAATGRDDGSKTSFSAPRPSALSYQIG